MAVVALDGSAVTRWLDDHLARGLKSAFAIRGKLTPELAEILLQRNDANRKVSVKKVDEYAADIAEGRWKLNGEPVILAKDGSMNDGQHRCAGVLQASETIETFFVFGVERDTRFTVDQGMKRTIGHYLRMAGKSNADLLAAAAWPVVQYKTEGGISRSRFNRPTPSKSREFIQKHPDLERSCDFVHRVHNKTVSVSLGTVAALHYLFAEIDRNEADMFVEEFLTGANLAGDDPVFVLRAHILSFQRGDRRKRLQVGLLAEYMIRAWNARRNGRTLQRMSIGKTFPEIE